jgi:hypothetical protein
MLWLGTCQKLAQTPAMHRWLRKIVQQIPLINGVGQTPVLPNQMQLQFSPRLTDRSYVVETSATLGGWLPLTGFTTSDAGNVRTVTDLNANDDAKFYRVRIVKP